MIVVDTSVLIDFFRGDPTPGADRLRQIEIGEVPFAVPAICAQEVLQGAADEGEWSTIRRLLETQRLATPEDPCATHLAAARIYYDCRRQGITVRSGVDCFIAQLVLERGDVLLHSDADFERIRRVRPLQTLTE